MKIDAEAVFVSYGQVASNRSCVLRRLLVDISSSASYHSFGALRAQGARIDRGRNAFLVCAAVLEASTNAQIIAIGIHSVHGTATARHYS